MREVGAISAFHGTPKTEKFRQLGAL